MPEMIRVHDCITNTVTDRPRTAQEQQEVDAERAANAQREAAVRVEQMREAAIRAISVQLLDEALRDPNAPQEVKDYLGAISSPSAR